MIDRNLSSLFPPFAALVDRFINDWNTLHTSEPIGIFEGLRSYTRQAELFSQGRSTPGNIVTNAMPGNSWHQFGVAVDIVFDSDPIKPGLQASWDNKYPWDDLGGMSRNYGLEWAGNWLRFKERPHFQKTFGMQLTEAQELYRTGGLKAVWEVMSEGIPKV